MRGMGRLRVQGQECGWVHAGGRASGFAGGRAGGCGLLTQRFAVVRRVDVQILCSIVNLAGLFFETQYKLTCMIMQIVHFRTRLSKYFRSINDGYSIAFTFSVSIDKLVVDGVHVGIQWSSRFVFAF